MKAARLPPFVLRLSVAGARAYHGDGGGLCSGAVLRGPLLPASPLAGGCLSAPERHVFVCQQKVTFGTAVKVILHMFTDTPVTRPHALTYLWQGLTK